MQRRPPRPRPPPKWLRDAMLQPKVIDHHCQRVVRVVQRVTKCTTFHCNLLQEVDVNIL